MKKKNNKTRNPLGHYTIARKFILLGFISLNAISMGCSGEAFKNLLENSGETTQASSSDPQGVTITYLQGSKTSSPFKSGNITITATYNSAQSTIPNISIDTAGTTDLANAAMTGTAGGKVFTYTYTIGTHNGTTNIDGTATISLSAGSPSNNTFVTDTQSPSAPASFTLPAAYDTGSSNSDGITSSSANFQMSGTGEVGSTITVYDSGTPIGTVTIPPGGTWTITIAGPLANGSHTLTSSATDSAGNESSLSSPFIMVVDTTASSIGTATLSAADDTGASNSDAITKSTTNLDVSGSGAEANATISIRINGTEIATVTADGAGAWSYTIPTLATGAHSITTVQTDKAGNISTASAALSVTIDTTAPTVANVTSSEANGTYSAGAIIPIQVIFNENMNVDTGGGFPYITLQTGTPVSTNVSYTTTATTTLTFNYTVAQDNASGDLEYQSTTDLSTNGGSITDIAGNTAVLTLPSSGSAGSLKANKAIVIDTSIPGITNVTSPTGDSIYKTGSPNISIQLTYSQAVDVSGSPTLALNSGGSATCADVTSSTTVTCTYIIGATDNADDLNYSATSSFSGGTVVKAGTATNATRTLPATNGATSLGGNKNIKIDNTKPTITNVTASLADGSYTTGQNIDIEVVFSEVVNLTPGPTLSMSTTSPVTTDATYLSGSGSNTLVFRYTVASGNSTSDLDYASTSALVLNAGTINDPAGNTATLSLSTPNTAGSLGANKAIRIDTTAPTVLSVSSTLANGSYKSGQVVPVTVTFSENVNVDSTSDTPYITLVTTSPATTNVPYSSGTGSNVLTFNYTIVDGNTSSDLAYQNTSSLNLNLGTIKDLAGNNATLTLATPGLANSLNNGKEIVVDTTEPTISSISSSASDGTKGSGTNILIQVNFSENVNVSGTPVLALNSGGTASYSTGNGTSQLTFSYTVASGESSNDLDYSSNAALTLPLGATIQDTALNNADRTLPTPGQTNSLGANKAIVIDGIAPTVTSVSSSTPNGTYKAGQAVSITVTFSENINTSGSPYITLATGSPATTNVTLTGSSGNTLSFDYTISAGNSSSDLDYSSTTALNAGSGITDTAGNNATLTLPSPGATNSLGYNKNIVIDTTAPTVTNVSASNANGTYGAGSHIYVQVTFSENVTVNTSGGTPYITLSTTSPATTNASYSSGSGTSVLVFDYTVGAGNSSADLNYPTTGSLQANSGTIKDSATNDATLTLPDPLGSTSLAGNKAILINTSVPAVTSVTTTEASGSYSSGTITIQVNFDIAVDVSGSPALTLNSGGSAVCANGTNNTVVTCTYTIAGGHTSNDLDYSGTVSLTGGTIVKNGTSDSANRTLPTPGDPGSISNSKDIKIDTTAPTVTNVTSAIANGTYGTGQVIDIQVVFSETVNVALANPTLTLTTTSPATTAINYLSGSNSNTLVFRYTVSAGNSSSDLDYAGTSALALAGATIRDAALNNAVLTLATPGAAGSLGANKNIVISTAATTVQFNTTTSTALENAGSVNLQIDLSASATSNFTVDYCLEGTSTASTADTNISTTCNGSAGTATEPV